MRHRIVITEFMDAPAVEALRAKFDVRYEPDWARQRAPMLGALAGVPALIVRNLTRVDIDLLDAAPALKVVGRLGVGLDNIDTAACAARGITVIPASGANALSVAEYVVGTAMLLLRGAYGSSRAVADGAWPRPALSQGREIAGKTLGLVGFGEIGRLTAKLALGLGLRVVAFDPAVRPDDPAWGACAVEPAALDGVLAQADIVSLHVPLTDGTRNLFDAARIAGMKQGAVLINTARGGVIDEAALAEALVSGHLGGAAVDVFAAEPLAGGGPLARALDAGVANLILTPHVAGVTTEANTRVSAMIARRVTEFLENHAQH